MRRHPRIQLLGALAVLGFLLLLGRRDIATSHEARVAQTAREMAASGWPWQVRPVYVQPAALHTRGTIQRLEADSNVAPVPVNPWAVPLLKGEIRLQKPPLPYWCAAVLFKLVGFSEWAARLTPALLGALGLFLVYDVVRMLAGSRRAFLAALAWVTTLFLPDEYRRAMADPYLAFFVLCCVWAWIRAARRRGAHWGLVLVFYVSMALGLLAKGPPLFVHLVIAIGLFVALYRQWPRQWRAHLAGVALLLVVTLPWPLYVVRHVPHAMDLWRYESIGELTDNTENARPFWFYLPSIFYITVPWTAAWTAGIVLPLRRKILRRRQLFPILWLGLTVVFFSFVNLKKNPYLLPAMPAQVMIVAEGIAISLAGIRRKRYLWAEVTLVAQYAIGVIFGIVLLVLVVTQTRHAAASVVITVIALLLTLLPLAALRANRDDLWLRFQVGAYLLLVLAFMNGFEAPLDNARSAKRIATELLEKAHEPDAALIYARLPEDVAVYIPLDEARRSGHRLLAVVDDQPNLRRHKKHPELATQLPSIEEFSNWVPNARIVFIDRVPMKSAPGDNRWKVYELTVQRDNYAAGSTADGAVEVGMTARSAVRSRSIATW